MSVLNAIGNTPLVQVKQVIPPGSARVLAKLEWANPTGSMKDRMAVAAIEGAEAEGRLRPGGTVVEYTGGTTGVSLAFVCAAKGYKLRIVFSDAFSEEKALMMRALGAEITIVPSHNKGITERLIKEMMERSRTTLKTVKMKGSSTELHTNVSSPKLNRSDFKFALPEGTVLKDSLFGAMFGGNKGIPNNSMNHDKQ